MGRTEIYETLICLFIIIVTVYMYKLIRYLIKCIIIYIKNEKAKRLYYKGFDNLLANELHKDCTKYISDDRFFTNDDFIDYMVKNSEQNNIN